MLWNTDDRVDFDFDVDAADDAGDAAAAHTCFDDNVDAASQPPLHLAVGPEEEDRDPDPDPGLGAAEAAGDVGDDDYGDVPPQVPQPAAEEAVVVPQRPSDPHNVAGDAVVAVSRRAMDHLTEAAAAAAGEVASSSSDIRLASQTTEVLDRKPQTERLPTLTDCCEERTSGRCKALLPAHFRQPVCALV